jgi:ABC-type phosphate transport system auxiliary subunit
MTWDYYEEGKDFIIEKKALPKKQILASLDNKQKKRLKKTLQAAEPTEFFGQDFTKLGELIETLEELDLTKSDKKLNKKVKSMGERNIDIVATATKLRKEYELLYRQLRDLVYPPKKRDD